MYRVSNDESLILTNKDLNYSSDMIRDPPEKTVVRQSKKGATKIFLFGMDKDLSILYDGEI